MHLSPLIRLLILSSCVGLLAGCASRPDGTLTPAVTIPTVDPATINAIRQDVNAICGVVPTFATVASIVATFTGGGAIVDMIGQASRGICAALTNKGARRGAVPTYQGVRIRIERG